MRALVLLLINIFCLAKFVKSYGVAEHRIDYFKSSNGHEYDYHYQDGTAPRFDKNKFHLNQQQLPQLIKDKRPFKLPYIHKYFATGYEQVLTHQKQSPTNPSFKQQNSFPIFESHEKILRSYADADDSDYDEDLSKQRPGAHSLTKNTLYNTANYHRTSPHRYNGYDTSHRSESESEESINVPVSPTKSPFASHLPLPGGYHYIPSGYTYFHTHTLPQPDNPSQLFYFGSTEASTTTRRPYVAPSLTSTTPTPSKYFVHQRPTRPSLLRRPYLAPSLTTTKRPYVAPLVTRTTPTPPTSSKRPTGNRLQNQSQNQLFNGASRFRYTASKTATTSTSEKPKPSDLYEPEFDIDIRIDLSPDSS
ncbi:uncharacterized protein LOC131677429 [Topomyia yanbarensis]|uniref:uncharacterized protein LOC131677429 n=1 Tax=Topomyia yanbarensis TaxID=2498891 RepID=UPI00273ABB65|nr:uncharacterized protein LOC131677429 [Topomyia yanbarensis]